jgi:hypothetical protein
VQHNILKPKGSINSKSHGFHSLIELANIEDKYKVKWSQSFKVVKQDEVIGGSVTPQSQSSTTKEKTADISIELTDGSTNVSNTLNKPKIIIWDDSGADIDRPLTDGAYS